jgi:hypothetical protein
MQMHTKRFGPIWIVLMVLLVVSMACGAGQTAPTAAPVPTNTPRPADTPTSTVVPTATPDVAGTQAAEADQATLQKYVQASYLTSTEGTLTELKPATFEMAKRNFLNLEDSGYYESIKDFAFWGDVKWTNAGPVNYPEYSGCGIAFRVGSNLSDEYDAMITNDSFLVTWCFAALGNRCGRVGTTRGSGRVKFGNPAEAHLEFVVNGGHAYALVDGNFIGEYTLFQDRLTSPGFFAYSIISGTNKDFGTRCTIENAKLWVPNQ